MAVDVLIVGASGMLGHMTANVLKSEGLEVRTTARKGSHSADFEFDAESGQIGPILQETKPRYIVNSIGIIKPHIVDTDQASVLTAIRVNSIFPHDLATEARKVGAHVVQIATDCVYDGTRSYYDESSPHNPTDVYGKTKSLGEVPSENVLHLRASIIGPESGRSTSLWEWVRNAAPNSELNGYTNHLWNGVTTYHFAKVCAGLIARGATESGVRHLIPGNDITKANLVRAIANASGRKDLVVNDFEAHPAVDRTLATNFPEFSRSLWASAGYLEPPTVEHMVKEISTSSVDLD